MLGSWRGVTFESHSMVEECSLWSNYRVPKPNAEVFSANRPDNTNSRKKIKCPQSKHSKHAKTLNQTFEKKQVSPIPNPQPNLNVRLPQSNPAQPQPQKKQ